MTSCSRAAWALVAAVLVSICAVPAGADAPPIAVRDPWVAEAPPMARVMAGYLTLDNLSDREQVLIRVESPSFQRVEIHRTEMHDGIARMMPVEQLSIPPKGHAVFAPGGHHLMLIGPVRPLHAGDTVDLKLEFLGGHTVAVAAPVRRAEAQAPHGHSH